MLRNDGKKPDTEIADIHAGNVQNAPQKEDTRKPPKQCGAHPETNVSWLDAQEYVTWLSNRTGHKYRLPTEAEWEYVARAGSAGRFWWGEGSPKGHTVCNGCM